MTLTRKELAKAISETTGLSTQESAGLMDRVFEILTEALEVGEKVKISGFGNFVVRQKRPRRGRNPQTGGEIMILGRKVVTFKPSKALRQALKEGN